MKEIILTNGGVAIVDDEDFERLDQYTWWHIKQGKQLYAQAFIGGKHVTMHVLLIQVPKGYVRDHINGSGLDNRKENLRVCRISDNLHNTGLKVGNRSGFKGVSWDKVCSRWRVHIRANGKVKYVGIFKKIEDAVRAYNDAARKYYGEFAYVNKISEGGK